MKTIKASFLVFSLDRRYLENIPDIDVPEDLPFNNIFGDKYRIAIPMRNEKIQEIIDMLEDGEGNSGTKYRIDVDNQRAYKTVQTRKGPKEVDSRLGKTIRKELGQEWADEWSRQMGSEDRGEDYVIIVSRHPLDVVRMSDHREWSSCHAPPGWNNTGVDYFHCAVEEASDGGPIAYVIDKDDYELVKDDLQDEEIFSDEDRSISGISPISRIRLNRYEHMPTNVELAVPTGNVYGRRIAGFKDTLEKYFRKVQEPQIEEIGGVDNIDLDDFGRYGGTYVDSSDSSIFNDFFDVNYFRGEADYIGEGEGVLADMWQEELDQHQERANQLEYTALGAQIADEGNHLWVSHSVEFEFPNVIEENIPISDGQYHYIQTSFYHIGREREALEQQIRDIENRMSQGIADERDQQDYEMKKNRLADLQVRSQNIENMSEAKEEIESIISGESYWYPEDTQFDLRNNYLLVRVDLDTSDIENPDGFEERIEEAKKFEENNYNSVYAQIYEDLVERGLVTRFASDLFLSNHEFENLSMEYEEDYGYYDINAEIGTFSVPEQHASEIASELYNLVWEYVHKVYRLDQENLLFPIEFPEMAREQIPEPQVKIENAYDTRRVPDPRYKDSTDPWRYTMEKKIPRGFSIFKISFELPVSNFAQYNDEAIARYLRYLDRSIEDISLNIQRQLPGIIQKYNQAEEAAKAEEERIQEISKSWSSSWYKPVKTSKNWYRTIKAQEVLYDLYLEPQEVFDPSEFYEDLEERDIGDEKDIYCGRNVCWIGRAGQMIRVDSSEIYPIQGNIFDSEKYSAVVKKIEYAEDTVYFYAPYGDMTLINIDDIRESLEYGDDYGLTRNLTTGDDELDDFLLSEEEDYEEDELLRLRDELEYAIETESGDIGNLMFQVRDGNHRAFGALAAGEPYIWAMISSNQYNDIQRGADWASGYSEYLQ